MPLNEETNWPEVGRWISVAINDYEVKFKILKYEHHETGKVAVARKDTGEEVYLAVPREAKWKYIEEPSQEELDKAWEERLGRKCNHCGAVSISQKICTRCEAVRYCNIDCQTKDWVNHKNDCKEKVKLVLQPNPRYPLTKVDKGIARAQKAAQDELNRILKNALTGKFKVYIDGVWKTNPKSTDLKLGEYYALVALANKDYTYYFQQVGLESLEHSTPPSACTLIENLMMCEQGLGLHNYVFSDTREDYLVGTTYNCPGGFWMMVLNYHTFGTVAPLNLGCACNFPKMPTKWLRLRRDIDKMFSRAKADIMDVQCRFADTEPGCHAFGLPGELGCQFKHDILAEKVKKVKKVKKSGSGLDSNGNPEEEEDDDVLPELVEKVDSAPVEEEKIAVAEVKKEGTEKIKRPWQKNKSKAKKKPIF